MEDRIPYKRSGSRQKMLLKMIGASLMRRRSRMLVALLAVAIGATILSGLMTIYYDIPRQMGKEFRSYGANLIFLPKNEKTVLTRADVEGLKSAFTTEELEGITPFSYSMTKVNEQSVAIAGTDLEQVAKTRPYWHMKGEWPRKANEILIGSEIAGILNVVPGRDITIEYKLPDGLYAPYNVKVTGIINSGKSEDSMIFMSLERMEQIIGGQPPINVIELSVTGTKELLNQKVTAYSDDTRLRPRLVKSVADSEDLVLSKLQALVWIVTIVVLLLTMISVGTTMMAAVMERRQEIGLKKALGALDRSIIREFIYESLFLGIFGGALGNVFGFMFAQTVSVKVFGRGLSLQLDIILMTIAVSVVTAGLASFIPVRQSAEIDPAVVLKGE